MRLLIFLLIVWLSLRLLCKIPVLGTQLRKALLIRKIRFIGCMTRLLGGFLNNR